MLKHLYIIMGATFVFGLVTGVIVFFMSVAEKPDIFPDTPSAPLVGDFEITAYMYGACETRGGCPSYRIDEDGAYTLLGFDATGARTTREGALPESAHSELRSALSGARLSALVDSTFTGTCPADAGGVAFRYEIQLRAEQYSFNTCVQNLTDVPVFGMLARYFTEFGR